MLMVSLSALMGLPALRDKTNTFANEAGAACCAGADLASQVAAAMTAAAASTGLAGAAAADVAARAANLYAFAKAYPGRCAKACPGWRPRAPRCLLRSR
jgi:hypothetical protein